MSNISEEIIRKAVDSRKKDIVDWLSAIIRFPSENHPPDGDEREIQLFISDECRGRGFTVDMFSPDEIPHIQEHPYWLPGRNYLNERKNVVSVWKGSGKSRSILLSGHCDVAPADKEKWKTCGPYEPIAKDGRLYGRGSCDQKGGLAAAFWAMKILQELGFEPNGDIIFESVVDEEFAGGNGTLASRLKGFNADFAILTEPSNRNIYIGAIGAFLGEIFLSGKGSLPFFDKAVPNPLNGISKVIDYFGEWEKYWQSSNSHPLYPGPDQKLMAVLYEISSKKDSDPIQMGIPQEIRLSWITWCYPGMDEQTFYNIFNDFWNKKLIADADLKLFDFINKPAYHLVRPWEMIKKSMGVKELIAAIKAYCNEDATVTGAPFSCDMAIYGDVGKMPTVILGPEGGNLHTNDEWVLVDDIFNLIGIYISFISRWCS
jgi:acetylornithine deacetylase